MKKFLLFLLFSLSIQHAFSQAQGGVGNSGTGSGKEDSVPKHITTTVITIDLSLPKSESVKNSDNLKRLVVKNKNPLAFNLINGNPFRYRYALNFKKINLFTNETFYVSAEDLAEAKKTQDAGAKPISPVSSGSIIAKQISLSPKISKLKIEIEKFISDISDDSNLDLIKFNLEKDKFKKSYIEYVNEIDEIKIEISQLAPIDLTVNKNQDEIDKISESIRLLIEKLIKTKDNNYLLPIDINGDNIDYIEVQLDIYDGNNETPETYKYKVWIRGGLKIDASGGVFITSLFDDEYYTTEGIDNQKLIFKQDNGEYDFGFGTMVNISLRGGSWARPALNFGALFTSNQKFQMLAGFGLILGKSERLILNAGLSMGRVNVLNDNYHADGKTLYNLGTDGTIPTNEKFKFGNFFGITYNFTKPKSNKD
jgi:hypothetical protein